MVRSREGQQGKGSFLVVIWTFYYLIAPLRDIFGTILAGSGLFCNPGAGFASGRQVRTAKPEPQRPDCKGWTYRPRAVRDWRGVLRDGGNRRARAGP
ncbi:MAG: hypothetical protein BM562_01330 [Alphaproteobacteria bacterium MedPE-SWcel]|nr:MAG: hypothetical protein BM562_01330 [Alphaproteobacteria bacterium MedPE-SWcel]